MAKSVCFYFQVHQPYRIRRFTVFDIGKTASYFDESVNKDIIQRVAKECYLPMNELILKHIKKKGIKVAFSITGCALEQFSKYAPEVIQSFKELAATGNVEFLSETYYHSLSSLYSPDEFVEQVQLQSDAIYSMFDHVPKVFRNTELIFSNKLAQDIEKMGFKGVLSEGADYVLDSASPNYVYSAKETRNLKLLLKNYILSDDLAFRFSDVNWTEWPLKVSKYQKWLQEAEGDVVNLFLDYETFGEHQKKDTGILDFMDQFFDEVDLSFMTPSEAIDKYEVAGSLDVALPISWADSERNLSAWVGNKMQNSAVQSLFGLEHDVKSMHDQNLLDVWRKMQGSDHFYYMCTKWFNDGDVHKYFNPFESPYEAFIAFMNIVNDLKERTKNEAVGTVESA
ncbi:MAG: glycoside hydrolase family 57 protein [Candidatus Woesearchaeota archaeon]